LQFPSFALGDKGSVEGEDMLATTNSPTDHTDPSSNAPGPATDPSNNAPGSATDPSSNTLGRPLLKLALLLPFDLSCICSMIQLISSPQIIDAGYHDVCLETQLEERVPELPPIKVKDIPRIRTTDPEITYHFISRVCEQIKVSRGLIFNSFEELENSQVIKLRQLFGIPVYLLGPFHKAFSSSSTSLLPPDESCITWLDKQAPKSVLYVSFGSIAAITQAEFEEIALGLANSELPFLWVVRPGLVRGSTEEPPFPHGFHDAIKGRAHIVKWAPQTEVLAHPATGGFWTHNGWNSTLESICEGVPMICLPNFADQMINARYVSDVWKVGIQLESGLERGVIERALKKLMVDEEGQVMRDRVEKLKQKASLCLKEGGSSYKAFQTLTNFVLSI
ncbi:hypothetical protein Dimus_022814, partial [Dionaea muscipula]